MRLRENAEISPGGEKETTSDFGGWSPEEVKEPNLQRTAVTKQYVHPENRKTLEITHLSKFATVELKS